ncbi:hypothetical protein [Bacillus sp. T3]|uniref:hypothetical protein n=1 Tax=Bacillus sp. T3 TaxID=467262 RepID=UPI002981399A|nr:hypothetical protein [Bacillus sp. T3]
MNNPDGNRSMQYFDNLMMKTRGNTYNEVKTNTSSSVDHSGNSDVDVNVNVELDMMPIALSLLCLSLVNKQISQQEFEFAVEKLITVNDQYKKSHSKNKDYSKPDLFKSGIWENK